MSDNIDVSRSEEPLASQREDSDEKIIRDLTQRFKDLDLCDKADHDGEKFNFAEKIRPMKSNGEATVNVVPEDEIKPEVSPRTAGVSELQGGTVTSTDMASQREDSDEKIIRDLTQRFKDLDLCAKADHDGKKFNFAEKIRPMKSNGEATVNVVPEDEIKPEVSPRTAGVSELQGGTVTSTDMLDLCAKADHDGEKFNFAEKIRPMKSNGEATVNVVPEDEIKPEVSPRTAGVSELQGGTVTSTDMLDLCAKADHDGEKFNFAEKIRPMKSNGEEPMDVVPENEFSHPTATSTGTVSSTDMAEEKYFRVGDMGSAICTSKNVHRVLNVLSPIGKKGSTLKGRNADATGCRKRKASCLSEGLNQTDKEQHPATDTAIKQCSHRQNTARKTNNATHGHTTDSTRTLLMSTAPDSFPKRMRVEQELQPKTHRSQGSIQDEQPDQNEAADSVRNSHAKMPYNVAQMMKGGTNPRAGNPAIIRNLKVLKGRKILQVSGTVEPAQRMAQRMASGEASESQNREGRTVIQNPQDSPNIQPVYGKNMMKPPDGCAHHTEHDFRGGFGESE